MANFLQKLLIFFRIKKPKQQIEKGFYRHFKGHVYEVIAVAKHSEDLQEMVVYVSTINPEDIWVRPAYMFLEQITRDGKTFTRFERVES
jgi:hypothetical protein